MELAEQITLLDHIVFRSIPYEWVLHPLQYLPKKYYRGLNNNTNNDNTSSCSKPENLVWFHVILMLCYVHRLSLISLWGVCLCLLTPQTEGERILHRQKQAAQPPGSTSCICGCLDNTQRSYYAHHLFSLLKSLADPIIHNKTHNNLFMSGSIFFFYKPNYYSHCVL